ncbi:MAG: trypsin-like peptidase domain-containing protein [Caenispirillum sp.]|nr:trypsin-like peptidase domain-containing protein [Caenispirillum sp.]
MTSYVGSASTSYPYTTVVHVTSKFADGSIIYGSGVMVGKNDVLTAAHIVYSGTKGKAVDVEISPGRDGGNLPFGSYKAVDVQTGEVDANGDGYLTVSDVQVDVALLSLSVGLGERTGYMLLDSYASSGSYEVTGYPRIHYGSDGPHLTTDAGTAWPSYYHYTISFGASLDINPGNSGGPVWRYESGMPTVASLVSTESGGPDLSFLRSLLTNEFVLNDKYLNGVLRGGDGSDKLYGGNEGNFFETGEGFDQVMAGGGADAVFGGGGGDYLVGEGGDDQIYGNMGNDIIDGGSGNDLVRGGKDADYVVGSDGNDTLYGDNQNDQVFGGAGDDVIYGGKEDDFIAGDDGNDWLSGDLGNDTMTGGAGADVFAYRYGSGTDIINDFNGAAGDRIDLEGYMPFSIQQDGNDSRVQFGDSDVIIIKNVIPGQLSGDWFI